uniref:Ribosomal protein L19 n=1 Tax=Ancoracysta twista TaxID=2044563 RepID=A0A2H4R8E2_9EUKA|nr:ribosomal protein L19 [Ancoracysta twista]ATY40916.1 ribosomal protein L19 [Ancoracysta twista]
MNYLAKLDKVQLEEYSQNPCTQYPQPGDILKLQFIISRKQQRRKSFVALCTKLTGAGVRKRIHLKGSTFGQTVYLSFLLHSPNLLRLDKIRSLRESEKSLFSEDTPSRLCFPYGYEYQ